MASGVICEGDFVVCVPKKKFFSKNKWVRCHATLYETGQLTLVGGAYEKVLDVSPKTKVKVVDMKGNRHCLSLDGKLVVDFVDSATRAKWQQHLALKATKKKPLPAPRKKKRSLQSFLLWHEEYYRSPEIASIHRRRWFRAIDHVAREVLKRRNVLFGYTSLELIQLQRKIVTIENDTKDDIKRKARRILRQVLQDAKEKKKWNELVCGYAETKGIAMSSETRCEKKDLGRNSAFKERLQVLLRREKVLPTLTRTLEVVRRKERHAFVLADAMRGLWVARCVRALLNLPGGLAALLAMPSERGPLRRLLAAAMLCRIPLLTSLVLEILGALALLPGNEGVGVVMNVLAQIDRAAKWGEPVCSDFLMRPSAEALRWSNTIDGKKPSSDPHPFCAIATLLYPTREHSCCPELGCGVITLFAALCRCQRSRSAAQWMQAHIFLACRAALKCDIDTHPRRAPSRLLSEEWTIINDTSPATTVQKRIQERRKMIGRERKHSDDFESASLEVMHPCPPLLALLIDAQRDESNKIFAMQLEHFLDGWDHRELDEADEIDKLDVGAARRIGLLSERVRRSALLLGRHVHIDDALHSFGLDLEHAALTPFQVMDANVKAAVDSSEVLGATILFDVHSTVAALGKLQTKTTTGTIFATLESANGDGLKLKDDPRYAKYFRMIKLHIPKMAVAAKMASEGLDPAILDLDSSQPAPPSPEQKRKEKSPPPPPLPPRRGNDNATEKEEQTPTFEEATEPGLGCVRAPSKRLRRVYWDVVDISEGTWWDQLDDDSKGYFLDAKALEDLESVFEQTRRGSVIQADSSSAARTLQKEKLATQQKERHVVPGAQSLVAQALGEKRAFALNLLYGSIRISNDECTNAVAELDPGGQLFVSNLPRLGTVYSLVQRSDELASIEQAAINADILVKSSSGVRRNPENDGQLDGLSDLMVSLLEKARRPRAKVKALWLVATAKDQASELSTQLKNYEAAARCVIESASLRKLMCVVLSVTNFVNHGSERGQSRGVRLDALTKLSSTRTTGGSYKNLLQFVVRHSRVSSQALKEEIPLAVLRSISARRSHLSSSVAQLISERDDAVTERGVLQREATTTAGVDARRVAQAAAAAARMAQIVADVDDELDGLRKASSAAEDVVNGMLLRFGEPPASVDAFDWFRDLDSFITQYDDEYGEYLQVTSRKERRALLAKKQQAREMYLAHEERPHESTGSQASDKSKHLSGDARDFDRAVESAQRSAIVEMPKRSESTKIIDGQGLCAECKVNSKLSHPGAYSKSDGNWYCADCWYDFSFKNETWKDEFGEETQPLEAIEDEEVEATGVI